MVSSRRCIDYMLFEEVETCDTAITGVVCSQVYEPQPATCTCNTCSIHMYHSFHCTHALP